MDGTLTFSHLGCELLDSALCLCFSLQTVKCVPVYAASRFTFFLSISSLSAAAFSSSCFIPNFLLRDDPVSFDSLHSVAELS